MRKGREWIVGKHGGGARILSTRQRDGRKDCHRP